MMIAVVKINSQKAIHRKRRIGWYLKIWHVEDSLHVSVAASFLSIGV